MQNEKHKKRNKRNGRKRWWKLKKIRYNIEKNKNLSFGNFHQITRRFRKNKPEWINEKSQRKKSLFNICLFKCLPCFPAFTKSASAAARFLAVCSKLSNSVSSLSAAKIYSYHKNFTNICFRNYDEYWPYACSPSWLAKLFIVFRASFSAVSIFWSSSSAT